MRSPSPTNAVASLLGSVTIFRPFRRLLARHRLRQAGYCPRHLIQKLKLSEVLRGIQARVYAGDHDLPPAGGPASEIVDRLDQYRTYCELCTEEKTRRDKEKLDRALKELGGRLG